MTHIYYEHYKNKFAYKYLNVATINVSVTDDLTGKTYFGMTNVVLRRTDVELRFSQANPRSFKPNVPFQILVRCGICMNAVVEYLTKLVLFIPRCLFFILFS